MSKPETMPDDMGELMGKCWLDNPEKRPTFTEIRNGLESVNPTVIKASESCTTVRSATGTS